MSPQRPTLPVGSTCNFYPRGDVKRLPIAAIVTGTDQTGVLDLAVFTRNSRTIQSFTGVRHRSDPFLEEHASIAFENGVWDFVPAVSCQPCDLNDLAGRLIDSFGGPERFLDSFRAQWTEQKVFELTQEYGEGSAVKVAEIMASLTSEEWNYQRVNAILRKRK